MLKTKQQAFITHLIQLGSVKLACEKSKIATKTYYNWLKDSEFTEALNEVQKSVYSESIMDMQNLFKKAVEKYETLLNCDNKNISVRVATAIINNSSKFSEIQPTGNIKKKDLFERIRERTEQLKREKEASKNSEEMEE